MFLGLIPANAAWRQAESGIAIFVRTNGVHTWILMPKTNAYMDWRPFIPGAPCPRSALGRGQLRRLRLWRARGLSQHADLGRPVDRAPPLCAAFGGGEPLVHVEHVHEPREDDDHPADRAAARTNIAASPPSSPPVSAATREGRTMPVLGRGYRDNDIFYEANGGYSAILTCNEWTGRALRAAGVRTGLWTPLEQSIMWRLD